MNYTISENGLVPFLFVFGTIPRFPVITSSILSLKKGMNVLTSTQMEMNAIVAERRIKAALKHNAPRSVDDTY